MALWSEFCEEDEDVESVLFGEMDGMRVVDLLDAAPDALLDDELLYTTMATARLATYGLLLSYVMHPPDRPTIYGAGRVHGRAGVGAVGVVVVDGDASFGLLLVAVFIHTFQLPSSLLRLLRPVPALPLVVGLRMRVTETVLPIVGMFLPVLLLIAFLLSASVNGVYLTAVVPMETRSLLLLLLFALIVAVFFCLVLRSNSSAFWQRQMEAVRPGCLSRSQTDLLSNGHHLLDSGATFLLRSTYSTSSSSVPCRILASPSNPPEPCFGV
ncbi:uncharacterized protein EV420DRAFT_1637523 [Desarmillaria tabescens]|uniref:Uncharacterized protein n=1 Tax=Armillaria tabescens TaxID=1929756 RepID=A0AA39T562_ARMTA|nr:uncharacterized protein EV420DRAFT_1637523 [Desarmillaria tabescens]KAK0465386.1 hypothetical protein EV420DRAFT_1637523 [Desarmillaria tabescens]